MKKFVLGASGLLISVLSFTQTKKNTDTSLVEITVFSSPFYATKKSPVTHSNLSKQTLQIQQYGQELSQVLKTLPSITAYTENGANMGYSNFRIRGIDQNRINISLNGLPLNEPEDQGVYLSNFPNLISNTSSIQVQRGIGLSKTGVQSFAGSVEIATSDSSLTNLLETHYGSFNSFTLLSERGFKINDVKVQTKLTYLHTDGFKQHSSNKSFGGFIQATKPIKNGSLSYIFLGGQNQNQLAWLGVRDSLLAIDKKQNGNSKLEEGNFMQFINQLNLSKELSSNKKITASIFYNYTSGIYGFDLMNFLGFASTGSFTNLKTYSSFGGYQFSYTAFTKNLQYSFGSYGSLYKKTHIGINEPQSVEAYSNYGTKNELIVFAKATKKIKQFSLLFDLQYRTNRFAYVGNANLPNFNFSFLNPLFGISYELKNELQLYASIGRARREPARNDIFLGNDNLQVDAMGNAIYASLLPEQNTNTEFGIRWNTKHINVNINAYHMTLTNELTLNGQFGPTGLPLRSNVAKTIRQGIELEATLKLNQHVTLAQATSINNPKTTQNNVSFTPVLTPHFISTSSLNFNYQKWNVLLQYLHQSKSYINFANTTSLPAANYVNIHFQYNHKKTQYFLKLINLSSQPIYMNGNMNFKNQPLYHIQANNQAVFGIKWMF